MDTSKLDVGIDALDRMDAQAHRDGTCLCQETPCHDPAGCGSSAKQGHCHCGDPSRAVVREAAAALGRRGGKAGRGASQVRGDSDHYRAIRAKRVSRQYVVWMPATPGAGMSAVATAATLGKARRIARDERSNRPDLTWQDVQIRGKASGMEYAGPSR